MLRECYQCGMSFPQEESSCPKCDYGIFDQNRELTLTRDIAHNRQTVDQATTEFYAALNTAIDQNFGSLRLVVGGGLINKEIQSLLDTEKWRGSIRSFDPEPQNSGAYLVKLI